MTHTQTSTTALQTMSSWRYRIGLSLFIAGNALCLSAPLLPAFGVKLGVVGGVIVAGEIAATGSIFFLGKEGFKYLKRKLFKFLKPTEQPISRTRHRVGVGLLIFNFLAIYAAVTLVLVAYSQTTLENPFPIVFGLNFEQQGRTFLGLFFGGEAAFIAAIYVLGAEWWERFKQLFQYHGEAPTA
jgi:hypothetical protein